MKDYKIKLRLLFKWKSNYDTKNHFSLHILPTIWLLHNSSKSQYNFVMNKNHLNMMYDYTSIYLSWFTCNLIFTIGKQKIKNGKR
jgi:hypothetical protein